MIGARPLERFTGNVQWRRQAKYSFRVRNSVPVRKMVKRTLDVYGQSENDKRKLVKTVSRMNFFAYVGHATVLTCMLIKYVIRVCQQYFCIPLPSDLVETKRKI